MNAPKNLPASVKARLLNVAESRRESFNDVVVRYCIERLLYRLSQSKHADRFLLKGAMLFIVWDDRTPRPTKDVDFLGFGKMETNAVAATFREIITTSVSADGLEFDADSVIVEEIREGAEYSGIRVKLVARLGSGRVPVQVDIGSGDAVTPDPETTDFPALLDFAAPRVRVYPVYTVVAEKFEAVVSLGLRNTRMKDYYDLWFLSRRFDFDGATLHRAIKATFDRRGTALTAEPLPFTAGFVGDADRHTQWRAFLNRNALKGPPEEFSDLMKILRGFLVPAVRSTHHHWRASVGWE